MDSASRINQLHAEIVGMKKKTLQQIFECGRLLTIERDRRPGFYLTWLKTNVNFSERTAHKYMRVFSLKKNGSWCESKTVAENLRENAIPSLKKSLSTEFKIQKIQKIAPQIKEDQAFKIAESFKIEEPKISLYVPQVSEDKSRKIRLFLFSAVERAHELGRKGKILTMDEKKTSFKKLIKIIETEK